MSLNAKKDKYLQIFNYLLEFSKLRSKPIRDINNSDSSYPEKIWFSEIPLHELIECISSSNGNHDSEYWIKINKPQEPIKPSFAKLSDTLEIWIVKDSLTNGSDYPKLHKEVIIDGENVLLDENEEVEVEFQNYVDFQWTEDYSTYDSLFQEYEIKHKEYERVNKIYKELFRIYNKVQQYGEEFELVVGVGLLKFKEGDEFPQIVRHIFTSKAEIAFEFSLRDSYIKVTPAIESDIQIETDAIIDLEEQFDAINIIESERQVLAYLKANDISDIFDPLFKNAIQIFADRFRADGVFKDELNQPEIVSTTPSIYFAPTLILRKRNTRSLTALYQKIIQNITDATEDIDITSINDLVLLADVGQDITGESVEVQNNAKDIEDEIIYFPKKYNDEQIEIVQKSKRNNKVLVQGPPGTGKSHTIANLICHLLANGKKILVTAYTKRALEVLKDQLPTDFQSLTVNLLSGDTSSIQDLQASVNAINEELSKADLKSENENIINLERELSEIKGSKAFARNEWLKVKEKAVRKQLVNDKYSGTLLEIAEKLESEVKLYEWYKDSFNDITDIELYDKVNNLVELTNYYNSIDCSSFPLIIPDLNKVFSTEEVKKYVELLDDLEQYKSYDTKFIECNDFILLKELLRKLISLTVAIESSTSQFKAQLIGESDIELKKWNYKVLESKKILVELSDDKLKAIARDIEIIYPADKNLKQLKSDALALLEVLKDGKKLTGLFSVFNVFGNKEFKEKKYFVDSVKINGSTCNSVKDFNLILEDIKIKQEFKILRAIWNIQEEKQDAKPYFQEALLFRDISEQTEQLFTSLTEARNLIREIEAISTFKIELLESKYLKSLINVVDKCLLTKDVIEFERRLKEINHYLTSANIHPISTLLIGAINSKDIYTYQSYIDEITTLNDAKQGFLTYETLINELRLKLPYLTAELLSRENQEGVNDLKGAIFNKHAFQYVTKLLKDGYEQSLVDQLIETEKQEEKIISKLASKKAWLRVLQSLEGNRFLRQHLEAWVQAVRKIGVTGKGKRALKFQKEAQIQMEQCKESVPCWIMPLYKVAETINPEQGMYDYVIIDEASQLGPDAIFLLYISKNIIIVGDDKQTSPEYVGVDGNTMTPHINRHLRDIPFANYYGTEFSFFDHAKRFCEGVTVLREHFRCMPEIIEFCNKHFYAPNGKGLYPLKQYSENRLKPLNAVYCQNGYTDGQYQNIINPIEADGIANKIAELIKDERYDNKSFGVIALQGNKQATLIENILLKKIGEIEYRKRKIVCGNSASFQGDERDIIFLSLITASDHKRNALTKPEDERRFNVAVSRAKEQIWLYHSVLMDDLSNTNDLRHKLLDHFLNYEPKSIPLQDTIQRTPGSQPDPFDSWFEVDVFNDIVNKGFKVIPQYEVAKGKYRIDLVALLGNGVQIAIECDGDKYHGPEQFQNDMMRQRVLERCGWQFFRVRGVDYYVNRFKALEPLWALLNQNKLQTERIEKHEIKKPFVEEKISVNQNFAVEFEITNSEQIEIDDRGQLSLLDDTTTKKPKSVNALSLFPALFDEPLKEANATTTNGIYFNKDGYNVSDNHSKSFNDNLIFTTFCNVYKVQNKLGKSKQQIISELEFEIGEKPIFVASTNNYNGYIIVGFENGKLAKIFLSSYKTEFNRKKLKNAISDDSKVIYIEQIIQDIDLVAISSIEKIVLFNTIKINAVDSKQSKGVQIMKSKDGSKMTKIKKLSHVSFNDPDYYRKDAGLNVVGYYLKAGDSL